MHAPMNTEVVVLGRKLNMFVLHLTFAQVVAVVVIPSTHASKSHKKTDLVCSLSNFPDPTKIVSVVLVQFVTFVERETENLLAKAQVPDVL